MTWDKVLMWVVLMGWGALCVAFVVGGTRWARSFREKP